MAVLTTYRNVGPRRDIEWPYVYNMVTTTALVYNPSRLQGRVSYMKKPSNIKGKDRVSAVIAALEIVGILQK